MSHKLTIGYLAKETETKVETVRWYEKVGLLGTPARSEGNYRLYATDDLKRLRFIRRARALGFSLDQVRALLDLAAQKENDCHSADVMATEHLAEIDRKISDLTALRRELAAVVSTCSGGTVAECRVLEAFAPQDAERNGSAEV